MSSVPISYHSDVLCIWAYVTERRIEQLVQTFGDEIVINTHYCSVFPDAWAKIDKNWGARGGFEAFNRHLNEVAERFPHIQVHKRLWLETQPRSSSTAHLFLKAVELVEAEAGALPSYQERLSTRAAWALRCAFFEFAIDISDWQACREITIDLNIDYEKVDAKIRSSEAVAALATDYDLAQRLHVEGSPTLIMNDGRQKLFGNVGYRLLEANVQELLRNPSSEDASWC